MVINAHLGCGDPVTDCSKIRGFSDGCAWGYFSCMGQLWSILCSGVDGSREVAGQWGSMLVLQSLLDMGRIEAL